VGKTKLTKGIENAVENYRKNGIIPENTPYYDGRGNRKPNPAYEAVQGEIQAEKRKAEARKAIAESGLSLRHVTLDRSTSKVYRGLSSSSLNIDQQAILRIARLNDAVLNGNISPAQYRKELGISDATNAEQQRRRTINFAVSSGKLPVSFHQDINAPIYQEPVDENIFYGDESQKQSNLSRLVGYDLPSQFKKSKDRFGLDLFADDVGSLNYSGTSGSLFPEAVDLFERNKKIDSYKSSLSPVSLEPLDISDDTDYDVLFSKRDKLIQRQNQRLDEINAIPDEDLKIATFETDFPAFKSKGNELDSYIGRLDTRVTELKSSRKPQKLIQGKNIESYRLKDLVDQRNFLTEVRNAKVRQYNEEIKDPALKFVSIEQDIPQYDDQIGFLDSTIDKSVKFAESRTPLSIDIYNEPVRRGRVPKEFSVMAGTEKKTFRRNQRGAMEAMRFFEEQKGKKEKEFESYTDPIEKGVAFDQDLGVLDIGIQSAKVQGKALKAEKRQELENLNAGGASTMGFQPFTPSDTPTGELRIDPLPRSRGTPKIFEEINFGMRRSGLDDISGRPLNNEFDLGNLFGYGGGKTRIPKRQKFDFF